MAGLMKGPGPFLLQTELVICSDAGRDLSFCRPQNAGDALFPDSYTLVVDGAVPTAGRTLALASEVAMSNRCR